MIRGVDLVAVVDRPVGNPAESRHRRPPAFDPEGREGLKELVFEEKSVGQDFGADDGALSAAAMKPDFVHDNAPLAGRRCGRLMITGFE
jgi:hypothetical protein